MTTKRACEYPECTKQDTTGNMWRLDNGEWLCNTHAREVLGVGGLTMTTHTPGPWCPNTSHCYGCRLAPEMLALLTKIANEPCDHGAQSFCPREDARALLARIEGKG